VQLNSLDLLQCTPCRGSLRVASVTAKDDAEGDIVEGQLACTSCGKTFPIVRSLPRFVPEENYAASFGFQWIHDHQIQVDSAMGNTLSRDRFTESTGWPSRLDGEKIMEAGCGAGRFTQLALETGADVWSFDLSNTVDASWQNNRGAPNQHLFQASIYEIPLKHEGFDKVFCFGVLQHCPDVHGAFSSLLPFRKPGGEIIVDVYQMHKGIPPLKYWVRPFLSHLKTETIYKMLKWPIPPVLELKKAVHSIPEFGPMLAELIPIGPISHAPRLIYTDAELKEFKILSALDMFSPKYDQPQRIEDVRKWFADAKLVDVNVDYGCNGIHGRGAASRLK
jgi:SAM-dependent methyltransferase